MNASLNDKLRNVKWGEFKLGDLFEISSTSSFETNMLVSGSDYDYVTRTSLNQGVLQTTGFVNSENINSAGSWSLGLLQMDFFYRDKPWYAGQFMRIITPRIEIPKGATAFFSTVLNRLKPILLSVLVRDVDRTFRSMRIKLPVYSNGKINFEFMEAFIAEIETQRFSKLSGFLTKNGLDNGCLDETEKSAIERIKNLCWKEYRIGDLFEKKETSKLLYKAKDLPTEETGDYSLPCLTSSFRNQGLNYYVPRMGATVLKNMITIPQNSDVYRAYYQSSEFTVLSDAYAMDWHYDNRQLTREQYLFLVMCINKVTDLPIYSYKNKLGGWNVVKEKNISLPVSNGEIDFEFMNHLISAIEKEAIKDVVNYVHEKTSGSKVIANE